MRYNKSIVPIILLLLASCSSDRKKISIDGLIVEGNISADTIYNGVIKFYDSVTNKLLSQATYRNDTLEGERIEFYQNGKTKAKLVYNNGKENGYSQFYDSLGNIKTKQFYYYGLRVGPSIDYKDGQAHEFRFFSFDNYLLFYINYDSVKNRKIGDWRDNFFYINKSQMLEANAGQNFDSTQLKNEYFIYLIEPDPYKFVYSLCLIDNSYNVHKTLTTMDTLKYWTTFTIDKSFKQGDEMYAIKLDVFKDKELLATMFKKLE